ncbi:hypothetical protein [Legionella parisiensis]|uniref:Uncharacterized protein n=1 Tax=Legionella parisiensis TaxID=45071 RepID=A0A1E5JW53_9GAMM|nr:hypothetical protein [Legionella parisiensis]KTD40013.1 hypothetical protein Lpar_1330 [Legionella parisiensis]OEH48767.1 hypothetical protein lpari_00167 [Legionella parisiensis]STX77443.1 Uncharacterised protein [Legionella parisiensis]
MHALLLYPRMNYRRLALGSLNSSQRYKIIVLNERISSAAGRYISPAKIDGLIKQINTLDELILKTQKIQPLKAKKKIELIKILDNLYTPLINVLKELGPITTRLSTKSEKYIEISKMRQRISGLLSEEAGSLTALDANHI